MRGDEAWARCHGGRDALSPGALLRAFVDHRAIGLYAVIAAGALGHFVLRGYDPSVLALAVCVTAVLYPVVEYGLHRFVLHGLFLCRSRYTAGLWRRLHYDHHMDPNDLGVLFADPKTSIPLLVVLALVPAAISGRPGLFSAMLASNVCAFVYYEWMHTIAHLPNTIANGWLRRKMRNHMLHHHIDEQANYGIGSNLVDRLMSSEFDGAAGRRRSPTVHNLGYDAAMAQRHPWVRDGHARRHAGNCRGA